MVRVKQIFLIFILVVVSCGAFPQNLVRSTFDKSNFTFELTFDNEFEYPIYITKIGAITQVNFGDFNCEAQRWVPDPLADYVIEMPPQSDTIYQSAIPFRKIAPQSNRTITIGVVPDISKACDAWAIDVSALVKFHFGYTFQSAAELVMSQDVDALTVNTYTDQELQTMINSPESGIKMRAIDEFKFSGLNRSFMVNMLSNRLNERDAQVRLRSSLAVKDIGLTELYDQLVSNLFSTTDQYERHTLIRLFGKMKDPRFIDPLISRIINGDTTEARLVSKSLINMDKPEVGDKIRFLLQRHEAWATGTRGEQVKVMNLCRIAISYKDPASIPILKRMLVLDNASREVKSSILASMAAYVDAYEVVQDPFLTEFSELFEDFLDNDDDFIRFNTLNLLLAADNLDKKTKSKYIKRSLRDDEYHIRCRAAIWAGELGYEEFASDIEDMCQAAEGPQYTEVCEALIKLNDKKN